MIWGRLRAPDALHNRLWIQVDDGPWRKWRLSTGDIWYWGALHDDTAYDEPLTFALTSGSHTLTLANCVDGVALDALHVANLGATSPPNDTPCHPPHSIEREGACVPSCGSQGGSRCGEAACRGRPLLAAYDCDVCCREP
jgi:hypothetical protein